MPNKVNILHLSDLHFGVEPYTGATSSATGTALAKRINTLDGLLDVLLNIEKIWNPDVIIISGDVGWKGSKKNYDDAKLWIKKLLKAVGLKSKDLIICAGNHDIDRSKTISMNPPISVKDADDWLQIENLEIFIRPFESFCSFYDDLKIPHLSIGKKKFILSGQREVSGIRFVVLNSAWFSRNDKDKGNLWIGLPQIQVMKATKQLLNESKYDDDVISIAVLHHPTEYLNDNETNSYDNRLNTYRYLSEHVHIILSGHVHGAIEQPDRKYERARLFKCGATYAGDDYRNNFSIYQIDLSDRTVNRRSYEFDPRFGRWTPHSDIFSPYSMFLPSAVTSGARKDKSKAVYDYTVLAQKAKEFAMRFVERKSQALARTSTLPALIKRKVAVHNREERIGKTDNRLLLKTKDNVAPLSEMVSTERPTFLFGELGSGKSTLAGQYIVELSNKVDGLIPLLIPANFFRKKKFNTIAELSAVISQYVNGHVFPTGKKFELFKALKSKIEITLVVDGFDELDIEKAQLLLSSLEEITNHLSGLRVIATGRPIELRNLNYSRWQCLEMLALSIEEQEQLLFNEAIAYGTSSEQAKSEAKGRILYLRQNPELLGISSTPLAVRLLYPHLSGRVQTKSLGDLIFEVIQERLGNWNLKDAKDEDIVDFKSAFPDSVSREGLLGKIAANIYLSEDKAITRDTLHAIIEKETKSIPNRNSVISQGCNFFIKNILQDEGDTFTIASSPILQCALGIYILDLFRGKETTPLPESNNRLWREHSFAAAIARRKNITNLIRTQIRSYIEQILDEKWLPAVAIIVAESRDAELGKDFVSSLRTFNFRPLRYFEDFKSVSQSAYAYCFFLAGDEGFNWFFEEYLNPKYPTSHFMSDMETIILHHWLVLVGFKLTKDQREKLSTLPKPHIASGNWQSHSLLPTIAVALPELFEPDKLTLLLAECLSSNLLKETAHRLLKKEYESGNKDAVLKALEISSNKSDHGFLPAIKLWLELNSDKPPISIIHSAILSPINESTELIDEIIKRIGKKCFIDALRWYIHLETKIATHAALLLYKEGEKNLYLLGQGLIRGLHDGGKVAGAEEILFELIEKEGEKGLFWLTNQFQQADSMYGAHSAYWRILLAQLIKADKQYPSLLQFAVRYLGEFILPRYPDIRRQLHMLLITKPEYKSALKNTLRSLDNSARFNAACILLTCFPENESLAAEIVISSTEHAFKRHEWLRFCMRLSLGQEVLNNIASKIESFLKVPKTFALVLLYHNGYSLSDAQYRELLVKVLEESSFDDRDHRLSGDDLKQILVDDRAFKFLLDVLNSKGSLVKKAAEELWRYHRGRLTTEQYAKCWTFIVDDLHRWNLLALDEGVTKYIGSPEFVKQVGVSSEEIMRVSSVEPLAHIYIRTLTDQAAWKDFIWRSIFHDRFASHDVIEASFIWLFNKGRKDPSLRKVFGEIAKELMDDPRVTKEGHANDAIYWLTFIAHEFSDLFLSKIENVVVNYRAIGKEAVSALIARLGYVPANYKPDDRADFLSALVRYSRVPIAQPTYDQVVNLTRDADEIHPELPLYIEKTLLSDALSTDEMSQLAQKSRLGNLFVVIISFCRSQKADNDSITKTIGMELSKRFDKNRNTIVVENSIKTIRKVVAENSETREPYFAFVINRIKSKSHPDIIMLIVELLNNHVPLDDELFSTFVESIAEKPYMLDSNLAYNFSEYLTSSAAERKPYYLTELKKAIKTLASKVEEHLHNRDPLNYLLFSLGVFYLQNDIDDESERVFLRGLQLIFIQKYDIRYGTNHEQRNYFFARDVLNAVYPILDKVSPSIIKRAIDKGASSDVPEISSVCRILQFLGR